ncbi:hypothetical protein VNI00_010428 [Paramarasmius palmivorus]|uniref:PARP-type domain-containing protein n=1 Tax=Paramarasmius palmivorus TaxID=297713 RepID=A0AAW0CKJ1_9AGAR
MPSGYRLEYAASNRAKCKGTPIAKGTLRFGTIVKFEGKQSYAWRHWGCVSKKQFENMKARSSDVSELDGYEDLKPEDQERVKKAYEDGHVAPEDIPESARKPLREVDGEEEEDKPKKMPLAIVKNLKDDSEEKTENKDHREKSNKARASTQASKTACHAIVQTVAGEAEGQGAGDAEEEEPKKKSRATMAMTSESSQNLYAVADFSLVPVGTGEPSVAEYNAECQRVLEKAGVKYKLQ